MIYEVKAEGRTLQVSVRRAHQGGWWVAVDGGAERRIEGGPVGAGEWLLRDGGEAYKSIGLSAHGERVDVQVIGHPVRLTVVDPRRAALALGAAGGAGVVTTEMPGAIVRVLVTQGQTVTAGQPVVVVEAMKMENEFKAPCDGTVQTVHVAEGDRVESGTVLVVIHPAETP